MAQYDRDLFFGLGLDKPFLEPVELVFRHCSVCAGCLVAGVQAEESEVAIEVGLPVGTPTTEVVIGKAVAHRARGSWRV